MPCMMNGKPVPGIKGQCPMGSTWAEDGQSTPESNNNQLFRDSKIFGNWFDPENYAKFKPTGKVSQMLQDGAITNWADNLQGYINESPRLSKLDKGMNDFFAKMGIEPPESKEEPVEFASGGSDSGRRGKATLNPQHKSRHGGTFEPTKMQTLMRNMKNPEWWSESISGLPSDTRLMRLGQLMNYYGKTPKGREASDDPSKLWAANEAAAQKNKAAVLAAGAKRADEIYGKKTIEDLTVDVLPDVKEMFGDTFWGSISSNPNASDEDAMMSLASQVATNIKAITVAYPDKTPGEVRKLALEQVMKDRKLEKLN